MILFLTIKEKKTMALNLNNVTIAGRLTRDVEVRTAGNSKVANVTVAVTRPYKNSEGNYEADFIDCEVWGQSAEFLGKNAVKGQEIAVMGAIEVRTYNDKDGQRRTRTTVKAQNVRLGSRPGTGNAEEAPVEEDDDAIPFA